MPAQEISGAAAKGALAIVTLPVKLAIGLARRASDLLGRAADTAEPQPEAPSGAREPAEPTAAERPEVVGEQTDGLEAARRA